MPETVAVDRLAYGDAGIGPCGKWQTVFVNGACPGDVALVEIDRDKGNFCEGHVVELVAPSDRVLPACPLTSGVRGVLRLATYILRASACCEAAMRSCRSCVASALRCAARRAHRWRMRAVEATNGISQQARVQLRFRCEAGLSNGLPSKGKRQNPCRRRMPACAHKQAQKRRRLCAALYAISRVAKI